MYGIPLPSRVSFRGGEGKKRRGALEDSGGPLGERILRNAIRETTAQTVGCSVTTRSRIIYRVAGVIIWLAECPFV